MRSVKDQITDAAKHVKDQFSNAFEHLAAPLSAAGAIGLIEKTFEKVQGIVRAAESAGVSTNFIQMIQNAGTAAGIAAPKLEKALDFFVKGLPAGSDIEHEFMATADAIAAIEDPAERARAATDAFGKAGVQLVAMLSKGADGVRELASGFQTLSEEEIKTIEAAHQNIQKFESAFTVAAGKFIAFIGDTKDKAGDFLADMTDRSTTAAEKLKSLWGFFVKYSTLGLVGDKSKTTEAREATDKQEKESADLAKQKSIEAEKAVRAADAERVVRENTNEAIEKYKKHLQDIQLKSKETSFEDKKAILDHRYAEELAAADTSKNDEARVGHMSKMADIKESIIELEQTHTKEIKKQADDLEKKNAKEEKARAKEEQDVIAIERARAQAVATFRDQTSWSVGDLAEQGRRKYFSGYGGAETYAERTAVDIQQLESRAKEARNFGNVDFADNLQNQAAGLRKGIGYALTSTEADPATKSEQHLSKLVEAATRDGIVLADDE